jgi:hypothetical protein
MLLTNTTALASLLYCYDNIHTLEHRKGSQVAWHAHLVDRDDVWQAQQPRRRVPAEDGVRHHLKAVDSLRRERARVQQSQRQQRVVQTSVRVCACGTARVPAAERRVTGDGRSVGNSSNFELRSFCAFCSMVH